MNEKDLITLVGKSVEHNPRVQSLRAEGRDAFQKLGLPENKSEDYRHTPITRMLLKNLSLEPKENEIGDVNTGELDIVDAHSIVFINGVYSEKHSRIDSVAGLHIMTLSDAVDGGNELALEHLGKYADHANDAFTAWNTAAWTNGIFISVADNTVLTKPVVLHYWHDARHGEVVSVHRNLFVIGRSSEVTIVEKYSSAGSNGHFSNHVTEAVVCANAAFHLYTIQNDAGNRYQYALTRIHQSDASRVNTFTFTMSGKLIRNNLQLLLDGEGIESHMFGLYLIGGETLADNHTVVDHRRPNSFSNEIYKGIMDGNSKGVFNGKIYVRPQAQKTNAFQANRNILLSDTATVNTKPQLEIWADDVKCSHGCTTGQLDDEAIFYLQARGIDKTTARAMMLYAFASEILDNVKHLELKSYFDRLVRERLHQEF